MNDDKITQIVEYLKENHKKISSMESCTGGLFAATITNIPGASEVIEFSALTYSTSFKIKMGVEESIINKYTVYSKEVSQEMAYRISLFSDSDYGIGITGKLNKQDIDNPSTSLDNQVYYSIYDREKNCYYSFEYFVTKEKRLDNKIDIIQDILEKFILCCILQEESK